ncbi:DUF1697 domain-containing protein [Streptococcus sp. FT1-106]|uniref:DUF1697 domain-containing protein n=1 Tax=unclassified Streptococcus TaxID=2608887 RepID=UPI003BF4ADC2
MRYILLLRGINVGGKNKVIMADLKQGLLELGFEKVTSYINSGNLFFGSQRPVELISNKLQAFFAEYYPFIQHFCLLSQKEYQDDYDQLPAWWHSDLARKDVLFYTSTDQHKLAQDLICQMNLVDEVVHFGSFAIFWGKYSESQYLKTAYHKELIKTPLYKEVTIRNGRTYEKLADFL